MNSIESMEILNEELTAYMQSTPYRKPKLTPFREVFELQSDARRVLVETLGFNLVNTSTPSTKVFYYHKELPLLLSVGLVYHDIHIGFMSNEDSVIEGLGSYFGVEDAYPAMEGVRVDSLVSMNDFLHGFFSRDRCMFMHIGKLTRRGDRVVLDSKLAKNVYRRLAMIVRSFAMQDMKKIYNSWWQEHRDIFVKEDTCVTEACRILQEVETNAKLDFFLKHKPRHHASTAATKFDFGLQKYSENRVQNIMLGLCVTRIGELLSKEDYDGNADLFGQVVSVSGSKERVLNTAQELLLLFTEDEEVLLKEYGEKMLEEVQSIITKRD